MDFDLKLAQSEIKECEKAILGGEFSQMKYINEGSESIVSRYKNLVVKQYSIDCEMQDTDKLLELSQKAIERKLDCAPYLEFVQNKRHLYAIMPLLNGVGNDNEQWLDSVINLGETGIERYYNNFLGLSDLGFGIDILGHNLIVDKNINTIDLSLLTNRNRPNYEMFVELVEKECDWTEKQKKIAYATVPFTRCKGINKNFEKIKLQKSLIQNAAKKFVDVDFAKNIFEHANKIDGVPQFIISKWENEHGF
jgi:hypothetical protein